MRRARIKAMASVPARRKPTRDTKEEPMDGEKSTFEQSNNRQTDVSSGPPDSSLDPSAIAIRKVAVENHEIESKPLQPTEQCPTLDTPARRGNSAKSLGESGRSSQMTFQDRRKEFVITDDTPDCGATDRTIAASANVDRLSPIKTSQTRTSFMRPTPRLDPRIRRNSIQGSGASASESEDDNGRRGGGTSGISNNVRNDSTITKGHSRSTADLADPTIDGNGHVTTTNSLASSARPKKRKIVISESARKLAESRREFLLKHEHKQPDKTKLIMYDLIYYNPVTNPMKKSDGSAVAATSPSTQRTSSSVITAETEDEDEEDESTEAMPVPQVKVGPDGSLVIDEQSLVIEHTGAKKNRQAMARTEALVDEDANGSGFYKKRQKSKDWPEWETLKFYKALNTVGTDFSLIQTLFPQRTRQEIKLKFKKEEKINPRLVEKALANHQEFDIDSLREDLATLEESIKKLTELEKTENQGTARQRGKKRKNIKSRRMVAASISEMNDGTGVGECCIAESTCGDDEAGTWSGDEKKSVAARRSTVNDAPSGSASTSSCNESGSDTEIYQVKPTRSGRSPKIRKLQAPMIDDDDDDDDDENEENSPTADIEQNNTMIDSKGNEKRTIEGNICVQEPTWKSQSFHKSLSGISQVEPGSLVIVSRESADDPGETVLQVYMVSSDIDDGPGGNGLKQNMTPVVLTPEILNTVTAGITTVTPIHVKPE